jgi:hypothetical protein
METKIYSLLELFNKALDKHPEWQNEEIRHKIETRLNKISQCRKSMIQSNKKDKRNINRALK